LFTINISNCFTSNRQLWFSNDHRGSAMSPDDYFISFLCISLASVFLALVIGTRGNDIKKLAATVSGDNVPFVLRRKARHRAVQRKTGIADAAIAAKARGERYVPPRAYSRAR